MNLVVQTSRKFRDFLNESIITKTDIYHSGVKDFWSQLWTSLDTIDDIEQAIKQFGKLSEEPFRKSSYVLTYGLLQALYVQQDAVENLNESLFGKKIRWEKEYPDLLVIRKIRNESIGHPTKTLKGKYIVIDRSSLSKNGFSYTSWSKSSLERNSIEFSDLLLKQDNAISEKLNELLKLVEQKEFEHKAKFNGESLASLIPEGEIYSINLLRNISFRPVDHLSWIVYQEFKEKYKQIKIGIEQRFGPIKQTITIIGTELLIQEIDRIFQRIDEFEVREDDVSIDIEIYTEALISRLIDLKGHLIEIDEKFRTKEVNDYK